MRYLLTTLASLLIATNATSQNAPPAADALQTFKVGLQSAWEVQWDQRGMPTQAVRWNTGLKVHIDGYQAAKHHDYILKALTDTAREAGLPIEEVEDDDAANVHVLVVTNNRLENREPCVTISEWASKTMTLTSATVKMRENEVWRCPYHESMHVMGLQGHPSGQTVLSYFVSNEIEAAGLLPLDKAMLHAWYSDDVKPGMNPFQTMPALADQLSCDVPAADKKLASDMSNAFLFQAYVSMRDYIDGKGDVPSIVRKSGKAESKSIDAGRNEMTQFMATLKGDKLFRPLQCKSPLIHTASDTPQGENPNGRRQEVHRLSSR